MPDLAWKIGRSKGAASGQKAAQKATETHVKRGNVRAGNGDYNKAIEEYNGRL